MVRGELIFEEEKLLLLFKLKLTTTSQTGAIERNVIGEVKGNS
jgi:hypothetical protein